VKTGEYSQRKQVSTASENRGIQPAKTGEYSQQKQVSTASENR
jgi:hypothetical protein